MRGKPSRFAHASALCGITPAGAGKTFHVLCLSGFREDHPRRCGENHHPPVRHHRRGGSPPQVRGKPSRALSVVNSDRITPAGAGKTATLRMCSRNARDHPRRCGENVAPMSSISAAPGSPPQVRGKHFHRLCSSCGLGITPAGAGKTQSGGRGLLLCRDHPRRCGENFSCVIQVCYRCGSPPQVRGKPLSQCHSHPSARITPAGAGKTS